MVGLLKLSLHHNHLKGELCNTRDVLVCPPYFSWGCFSFVEISQCCRPPKLRNSLVAIVQDASLRLILALTLILTLTLTCLVVVLRAGSIPPELAKLVALKKLSLHHNQLTGKFLSRSDSLVVVTCRVPLFDV